MKQNILYSEYSFSLPSSYSILSHNLLTLHSLPHHILSLFSVSCRFHILIWVPNKILIIIVDSIKLSVCIFQTLSSFPKCSDKKVELEAPFLLKKSDQVPYCFG